MARKVERVRIETGCAGSLIQLGCALMLLPLILFGGMIVFGLLLGV
jgi:hypothetical protein